MPVTHIDTTLGALSTAYAVDCPADPMTTVLLWKGEPDSAHEGWHITTHPDIGLLDERWAPQDDADAANLAALLENERTMTNTDD